MIDREKIIKIIEKNGTYNGRSLSFDYYVIQPEDLAKALIAAGIGDVSEWKRRAEVAERALNKACADNAAVRKQAVQEFADWVKIAFHDEVDEFIPSIMAKYLTESRTRN